MRKTLKKHCDQTNMSRQKTTRRDYCLRVPRQEVLNDITF